MGLTLWDGVAHTPDFASWRTVAVVAVGDAPRITVGFNYGGMIYGAGTGVVYLSPKQGDRSGMAPDIQTQFEAAVFELSHGNARAGGTTRCSTQIAAAIRLDIQT